MNIYTYLKNDHEKVAELFKQIIKTKESKKRSNYFAELKQELTVHADAENATYYKELRKHEETKGLVKHAEKEHAEVKEFLASFDKLNPESIEWMVQLGELKHSVEHHVEDEETKLFKESKKVLSSEVEKQLVEDMEAFKEKFLETM